MGLPVTTTLLGAVAARAGARAGSCRSATSFTPSGSTWTASTATRLAPTCCAAIETDSAGNDFVVCGVSVAWRAGDPAGRAGSGWTLDWVVIASAGFAGSLLSEDFGIEETGADTYGKSDALAETGPFPTLTRGASPPCLPDGVSGDVTTFPEGSSVWGVATLSTATLSGATSSTATLSDASGADCASIKIDFCKLGIETGGTIEACRTTASSVPGPESSSCSFFAVEFGTAAPSCRASPWCCKSSNIVRLSNTFLNGIDFDPFRSLESSSAVFESRADRREAAGKLRTAGAGAETVTASSMQVRGHNGRFRLSAR